MSGEFNVADLQNSGDPGINSKQSAQQFAASGTDQPRQPDNFTVADIEVDPVITAEAVESGDLLDQ